ncbi:MULTISPECIES: hypothetical protein [Alteromonas]|jgi:hypothetical protein|uniref:Entry exclusion lipoprotein TrbK n=3 Tax=Alteromonas stellipolaris TaxID=233316 RepID=A0AAW7Z3N6_9ALTE|nr:MULTISPECIES: hypothetical protein [Alteromonas]AMJ90671.1 hypothetical protein AV940_09420 [Alteromonas sp. Mac2]ALM91400.1 hypothetical protein AOR13_2391 [Alteromonas stellipolaris LMG 21856]AMJ74379.1 hypothetical protein AVL57_10630 [Alteromonas stellipolaris]AMJ86811.1 hypothetical protein AV939_09645 [Alteromonas sp. Mac1]AMJ94555.1 hypothetical protein AVL56_09770 [Alteromonas stellipolaris]
MFKTILVSLAISATLVGCGSTSNKTAAVATNKTEEIASNQERDDQICKMEKRIGSNMMRRVCYTVEERERMEEASREGWIRMQRGTETSGSDN